MDFRARVADYILFLFFLGLTTGLAGCGGQDRAETILPAKSETCGGTAITSRYIVYLTSGEWLFVENPDRENFKETFVRHHLDKINFIEYDQKIEIKSSPELIPFSGIDNWGVTSIGAPVAWQKNWRGAGMTVAVIDSGVDIQHPQLRSQIAFNPGEAGPLQNNGLDDDGNGYIDDYAGYSFYDQSPDVSDSVGHGTHVAGIIAAQHTDTTHRTGYTQGIAPQAKVLPVKFLGSNGGSLASALQGIDYAISRGANIINASWGGSGCSLSLRQKVTEALERNVLFVAAAGNNGLNLDFYPEYPAAFNLPLQITVGAIRSSAMMDSYSNYSRSLVHIFAPGTMIVSTIPGGSYAGFSGTSMAAPFVAAASAVLLGAHPELSLSEVRNLLFSSSITSEDYLNFSHGRLSLETAVNAIGR